MDVGCPGGDFFVVLNWYHLFLIPSLDAGRADVSKFRLCFIVGEKLERVRDVSSDLLHINCLYYDYVGFTNLIQVMVFHSGLEVFCIFQSSRSHQSR